MGNLAPGTYTATETIPAGWFLQNITCTDANSSGSVTARTATFILESGETCTCTFDNTQYASIGDRVWNDADADGIQDTAEAGIPDVTVELYDSGGSLTATTTTGTDGLYAFSNLAPGDYYLVFVAPSGYSFSPQD